MHVRSVAHSHRLHNIAVFPVNRMSGERTATALVCPAPPFVPLAIVAERSSARANAARNVTREFIPGAVRSAEKENRFPSIAVCIENLSTDVETEGRVRSLPSQLSGRCNCVG